MAILTCKQKEVLKKARKVYGPNHQILVSMEELCELATICSKYPRYEDKKQARKELQQGVLDELADVTIIMDHIKAIFGVSNSDLKKRVTKKVDRLERWLNHSDSPNYTLMDRGVDNDTTYSCDNGSCCFGDTAYPTNDECCVQSLSVPPMNDKVKELYDLVLKELKNGKVSLNDIKE